MIGKGATPSFFAIANYNYTLTALPSKISTIIEHKMAYRNDISAKDTNIKESYSRNKKRRGKSKYLLSVCVMVGKENTIAYPMLH